MKPTPKGLHISSARWWSNDLPQSLARIDVHLVFSTKDRRPLLQDNLLKNNTFRYIGGICNRLGCPSISVGGVEDHVHVLFQLGRSIEVSKLVRELKRESSKWIKRTSPKMSDFAWQAGYGAFSASPVHVRMLKSYISKQEEHHKRETFQDEFRRLLAKYDISWDERYVWD